MEKTWYSSRIKPLQKHLFKKFFFLPNISVHFVLLRRERFRRLAGDALGEGARQLRSGGRGKVRYSKLIKLYMCLLYVLRIYFSTGCPTPAAGGRLTRSARRRAGTQTCTPRYRINSKNIIIISRFLLGKAGARTCIVFLMARIIKEMRGRGGEIH